MVRAEVAGMTDALSKISSSAETGRKGNRDPLVKQGRPGSIKRRENMEDTVDISDEARGKSGSGKRKNLLAYLETEDLS